MSIVTNEWYRFPSFRRETFMTVRSLLLTSPLLAAYLYLFFNTYYGLLYYDNANFHPIYTYLISPFLFFVVSDFTFYWGHRFWHQPWLYNHSHYYHHSCRPTTSFAGNAADVFEIVLTGYLAAIVPVLVVPMHARIFLILTAFSHIWTIFLHNNNAFRVGFMIYDSHDHNIHHYYGQTNYNFGLYFQFWDRIMGTYKAAVPNNSRLGESSKRD
jgi:Delta7-sterol 5-desaturase